MAVRPLPPGSATPAETQSSPFLPFGMVAGPRKLLGLFISVLVPPHAWGALL